MTSSVRLLVLVGAVTMAFGCGKSTSEGTAAAAAAVPTVETNAQPEAKATAAPSAAAPAAAASADSAEYGKYYGSCKKDKTKHCSDGYCKGKNCEQLMPQASKNCDGVYSQTKCPEGANAICVLPTDIAGNIISAVNHYYDGENHEASCKAFGAKMLK